MESSFFFFAEQVARNSGNNQLKVVLHVHSEEENFSSLALFFFYCDLA
jgi:hypothetical protein